MARRGRRVRVIFLFLITRRLLTLSWRFVILFGLIRNWGRLFRPCLTCRCRRCLIRFRCHGEVKFRPTTRTRLSPSITRVTVVFGQRKARVLKFIKILRSRFAARVTIKFVGKFLVVQRVARGTIRLRVSLWKTRHRLFLNSFGGGTDLLQDGELVGRARWRRGRFKVLPSVRLFRIITAIRFRWRDFARSIVIVRSQFKFMQFIVLKIGKFEVSLSLMKLNGLLSDQIVTVVVIILLIPVPIRLLSHLLSRRAPPRR